MGGAARVGCEVGVGWGAVAGGGVCDWSGVTGVEWCGKVCCV